MDSSDCATGAEDSSAETGKRSQKRRSLFRGSSSSNFSSTSSSSESSEEVSVPSDTLGKNPPLKENNEISSTPAKSPSMKPERERQDKEEASKPDEGASGKSAKGDLAWSAKNEIAFLRGIAECTETGKPLPKYAVLCNHVKNLLDNEYSDKRIMYKLKRFKQNFKDVTEKVKDPDFSFRSPHHEKVFKLSKKIWGKEEQEETASVKRSRTKGKNKRVVARLDEEEEEEEEEKNGEPEEEEKEKNDEKAELNIAVEKNSGEEMLNIGNEKNSVSCLIDLIKKFLKEITDSLKEGFMELSKENMYTISKFKDELLVNNLSKLNRAIEENQRFSSNGEYNGFLISENELIQRLSSNFMNSPTLRDPEMKGIKRKWLQQEAAELEATSQRLALLQEERQMRLTKLHATRR